MKTGYSCRYNEETKKLELMEFPIENDYDFSHDKETNFWEVYNSHNITKDNECEYISKLNREIEEGIVDIIKCKDCGLYFVLPLEEKEWFIERKLFLPKRCPKCRKQHNRPKENK